MDEQPTDKNSTDISDQAVTPHQPVEQAPADALSQEPDLPIETEQPDDKSSDKAARKAAKAKQPSRIKKAFKAVNVYLLLFVLLVLIAGAFAVVNYLNSKKVVAPEPNIANQTLTQESLDELARTDVSVGADNQTFTVKGNADIAGQTLVRGGLSVAGTMQAAGALTAPDLTVSGRTNLRETQAQSLRVANSITIQGDTSLQKLNVSGSSSFQGSMTAAKITTSDLVLSGNATLAIPNHISFAGPSPNRTINPALGSGGSASVNGTDAAGSVNLNTGNNPGSGCLVKISFNRAYTKTPRVTITPVGVAAGRLNFYVQRDLNSFDICSANTPSANARLSFDYFITN